MGVVPSIFVHPYNLDQSQLSYSGTVLFIALLIALLYVILKLRNPRWEQEMNKYVRAQIKNSVIGLIPSDLNVTPAERNQQSTDGNFYGTTAGGGAGGEGTVFKLSGLLGPFIQTRLTSGKVAASVTILGNNLVSASSVTFNGTPASFRLVSRTEIKTSVPNGATTGTVKVQLPAGTLNSNIPFRVLPQVLSFSPRNGPPGTQVTITGASLTQTLGVGFGDQSPAQFTVNSDTQVTATVPQGARTGKVGVETEGGVAISLDRFTVTP